MPRTLCIGNQTSDTDDRTTQLATVNHGLLTDKNYVPSVDGHWHTSLADIDYNSLLKLATRFDTVHFFDQPQEDGSNIAAKVYKLYQELLDSVEVTCDNQTMFDIEKYWKDLFKTNESVCVYPFIMDVQENGTSTLCGQTGVTVTDKERETIKKNMLAGIKNKHCDVCHALEGKPDGFETRTLKYGLDNSPRIFESKDWISRLKLRTIEDLPKIDRPYIYDVRPSSMCNIACRTCIPYYSTTIDKEFKNLTMPVGLERVTYRQRDSKSTFNNLSKEHLEDSSTGVYVMGGEPLIMPEFIKFLRDCVDRKTTDFDLSFSSNATKISEPLLDILDNFSKVNFSMSLDGIGCVNDYIRWGSNFDKCLENIHRAQARGHTISFISVVSIYNIMSLDKIMEFLSTEFTSSVVQLQPANFQNGIMSPYLYPDSRAVLSVLERCKETSCYNSYSRNTSTLIDSIQRSAYYEVYNNTPISVNKKQSYELFFKFNDMLDASRNSKLADYIPELEQVRNYYN